MTQPRLQVPETLLERGAAILSGGTDGLGVPLVSIKCGELEHCELVALLLHYLSMVSSQTSPSVACLIDLHNATKGDVTNFVESIQTVEHRKRGRIAAVYCVKPKSKDRSRQLKKLLGLKPSKKFINVSIFKIIMPSLQASDDLLLKLPAMRDRMELLQDYDLADKPSDQLLRLRQEQLQQYQAMLKEIRLEDTIEQCKQALYLLENPESHGLLAQVHVTTLCSAEIRLRDSYRLLTDDQKELAELWAAAENRIDVTHKVQKCRERSSKIHNSIVKKYQPQLQDHPAIGKTLSQAELYRTHFTTSLYEPAKDLLTQATETLQKLRRLAEENPEVVCDISDVTQQLTDVMSPFAEDLQRLQDIYMSVHVFLLLYEKSVHWYKKVLKFLPDSLKERVDPMSPNRLIHTPPEWRQAVISFLNKHPPSREEHILKMDSDIPHRMDRAIKQQAHSLALRVRFLQRLLKSRRLPTKLVTAAFNWKEETMGPGSPVCKQRQAKPKLYAKNTSKHSSMPRASSSGKPIKPKRYRSDHSKTLPGVAHDKTQDREYNKDGPKDGSATSSNFILRKPGFEQTKKLQDEGKELFVRVTFTPDNPNDKAVNHFTFDQTDVISSQYVPGDQAPPVQDLTGSESGIDVVENDDPYDSIVNRIREVSVSKLPSELKLKYVTDLLHVSLKRASTNGAKTQVLDFQEKSNVFASTKNPGRHLSRSMGNLTDPVFYSSRDKSLFSFDDNTTEQRHFEERYRDLRNTLDLKDIGVVLGAMSDDEHQRGKLRGAKSMNDLYGSRLDLRQSVSDLSCHLDSMTSLTDLDDSADDGGSESTSLQFDFVRLKRCQEDRVAEEGQLIKEQGRYEDILLDAEAMAQDEVEASLRRSALILNEEEVARSLKGDNLTSDFSTDQDPSHLNHIEKHASTDLGYDSTVTTSQWSNTSTLQVQGRRDGQLLRHGPFNGPEYF
ncbi:uncharacterized protein LOC124281878 [Haliotis rubra]|uniref:uncharacterized protein LOC124281878 n=1 Tax=Haliotis rubra TaxID=36100 RepID=UPI001EE56DEB|nr:uncharacterized protein LOC124281878 [Haliotis rubra]